MHLKFMFKNLGYATKTVTKHFYHAIIKAIIWFISFSKVPSF